MYKSVSFPEKFRGRGRRRLAEVGGGDAVSTWIRNVVDTVSFNSYALSVPFKFIIFNFSNVYYLTFLLKDTVTNRGAQWIRIRIKLKQWAWSAIVLRGKKCET